MFDFCYVRVFFTLFLISFYCRFRLAPRLLFLILGDLMCIHIQVVIGIATTSL